MKSKKMLAVVCLVSSLGLFNTANAKGCLKGAVVGGIAGHVAGKHTLLGAAAGCVYGRHQANKKDAAAKQKAVPTTPTATPAPTQH